MNNWLKDWQFSYIVLVIFVVAAVVMSGMSLGRSTEVASRYGAVPAYKQLVYQGGAANLTGTSNFTDGIINTSNTTVSGNFTQTSGNFTSVGKISSQTLAVTGTATIGTAAITTMSGSTTATNITATNITATTKLVAQAADVTAALTAATISGVTNTTTTNMTATNITASGNVIAATATITTPTFTNATTTNMTATNITATTNLVAQAATVTGVLTATGTPVFANHASSNFSYTGGLTLLSVAHGMSSAPTQIFLQPHGPLGDATANTTSINIYWTSSNTTHFVVNTAVATNTTRVVDWLAFIAGE